MRVGVIGGGVVGSATAKCYAAAGHDVRVYDVEDSKATHPFDDTTKSEIVFVCIPEDKLDNLFGGMRAHFLSGVQSLHKAPLPFNLVLKSTVPVGTTRRLAEKYRLPNLVHSPEFLTGRTAEWDATHPRCNIVGLPFRGQWENFTGPHWLTRLYEERFPGVPVEGMTSDESEAVKLFTNTFFAVKVAAFNELRCLADKLGLDWDAVVGGMLADGRIHPEHTRVPGPDGARGFGGRCLPKDLNTFIEQYVGAKEAGWPFVSMSAVARNEKDRKESV